MFSFILILILSLNPTTAKGNPKIPPSSSLKYVNDYSNALSKSTKDYIISLGKELENKTGAQSVVVVMDSLHGYDMNPTPMSCLTSGVLVREAKIMDC